MTRRLRWLAILLCLQFSVSLPRVLLAQMDTADVPLAGAIRCRGEVVNSIEVQTNPSFELAGPKLFRRAVLAARKLHSTTNPLIIRRYLALEVGGRCTELRRTESERILRAQPYLAEAYVSAYPDTAGGVRIVATTVDEVSLIVGGSVSSKSPALRSFKFGEANLLGEAIYASVEWKKREFFRDEVTARFADYQLLGRPYQLAAIATRRNIGHTWEVEASHPFLTDLQRVSWRATAGDEDRYRYFTRKNELPAALYVERRFGDVGGLVRIGPPGNLYFVGGSVSREREETSNRPVVIMDGLILPDTTTALFDRYGGLKSTRVNALLGYRRVRFVSATGFETLDGAQDVRTGIQIGGLVGKGISVFDSDDRDYFVSTDIFGGMGTPTTYGAITVNGEARHNSMTKRFDGMLASGRGAVYVKRFTRVTLTPSLEWSAGWRQRVPFQLTLADREGGLIGYRDGDEGGSRRLIGKFEGRYYIGRIRRIASVGAALFTHSGKLWAGDAPLGVNTPFRQTVGFSLLAAVPPRSQRLWRLDFGFPLVKGGNGKFEVRLTSQNLTRMFWREPGDVAVSRERSIPTSIFNWP
jgi:hypothetical protein